jgi:hypothetical protein
MAGIDFSISSTRQSRNDEELTSGDADRFEFTQHIAQVPQSSTFRLDLADTHTLHAQFIQHEEETFMAFAGEATESVALDLFVSDENYNMVEYKEVNVQAVFPSGAIVEGCTKTHPFSLKHRTFEEAGVYKFSISVELDIGVLGPIERTFEVLPGSLQSVTTFFLIINFFNFRQSCQNVVARRSKESHFKCALPRRIAGHQQIWQCCRP